MTGRMVSDTTKIYIRSAGSSVAEAFRLHNTGLPEEQQINIKTAYAKVNYDRQKMLKVFPEDMLTDVATKKWLKHICIENGMPNSVESVIKDIEKRNLGYLLPGSMTVKKPAKSKP